MSNESKQETYLFYFYLINLWNAKCKYKITETFSVFQHEKKDYLMKII